MSFVNLFSVNGTIQLFDYDNFIEETWVVEADCDEINIQSEMFQTEENYDFVTISYEEKNQTYSGEQLVNQNASSTFSIKFESDDAYTDAGFVLRWICIKPKHI